MTQMYKGKAGQTAGLIAFIEGIAIGLDSIPMVTIMWLYTYVFKCAKKDTIIDVH